MKINKNIVHRLKEQVKKQPNKIALASTELNNEWNKVSWGKFNLITDAVSNFLIDSKFNPQDKAVIFSQNCPQWTCADVGILKSRGVVVPIYPTSTLEQCAYIINDANAKVVFVNTQIQYDMICQLKHTCPCIEKVLVFNKNTTMDLNEKNHYYFDFIISQKTNNIHEINKRINSIEHSDLFTLIYTSGTTGNPKGVMLSHKNLSSSLDQHDQIMPLDENTVSLAFLPLSHVFERGWSFFVLCNGGVNYYLSDTNKIKEVMKKVQPHAMCVVPRFLEKIQSSILENVNKKSFLDKFIFYWALNIGKKINLDPQQENKHQLFNSVKYAIAKRLVFNKINNKISNRLKYLPCGGALLNEDTATFFDSIKTPVLCGYGMTETTATVTCNLLNAKKTGSNGRSLPNIKVKIGLNNEILVKGDTVMEGYYNLPQENREVFNDGWLKTGDAGYLDKNGNLFITDRIKDLMKTSNGKYIAPQRIEGVAEQSPFIEQIAIVADAKNYVTALIVPAFEALETWAKNNGHCYNSIVELIKHSEVISHFESHLKIVQKKLAHFEQIQKFTLLHESFSLESGLITPTMKLKRKNIYQKYANEIKMMYLK